MKNLLYLFGEPGSGKITVARELQKRLGWRLFWLHDLDSVCAIVGHYPLPRLMDRISVAVLRAMMEEGQEIIYVRPSRDLETVEGVLDLAQTEGYTCYPVRLWASYESLVQRVASREVSEFRVSSKGGLDRYFDERPLTSRNLPASKYTLVSTDNTTVEQVADEIQSLLGEH